MNTNFEKNSKNISDGLVRGIGRWGLTAIAINTVIGAGIFGLPSKVFKEIGAYSLFAFVLCAVIVGLIVLCFSEVASRFESTGGMYLYGREAFGPVVGFEMGWLYWVVRMTTFAANCNLLLGYLSMFVPGASEGPLRTILILVISIFLIGVNLLGVTESTWLTNIFTIGKLTPLVILAVVGMFFIEPANFSFAASPETSSFSKATLLLIYAFVGFEATVIPAGESKDPKRDMPFALCFTLLLCAVLFLLVQTVSIGTLPTLANSERPLADVAATFLGAWGGSMVAVGAIVSILGNLNGGLLAGSRIPFAMAEQKDLPKIFGVTHPSFKTPWISLLLTGIFTVGMTLYSNFVTALTIATITRLLVYMVTCASLIRFRIKNGAPAAAFRVPFGEIVAVASLIAIGWLLWQVDYSKEGLAMVAAVLLGLAVFFINRVFRAVA